MASRKPARGSQRARTQRRTAEKRKLKEQSPKKTGGLSNSAIGGIITGLILIAIIAIVAVKLSSSGSNTPTTSGPALTNPNDVNPRSAMLSKGTVAPNFTLKGADGGTYTLSAQRGHPVLLEFFAVWCPHCQAEAPIMAKLTKTYVPKGVTIWSILSSPYGPQYESGSGALATKADVDYFARAFNVKHPQLIDPTFKVVNEYGIQGFPGLYVINKKGVITYANPPAGGEEPYKTIAAALDKALK